MLAKVCMVLLAIIVVVSVVEYVWDLTPLEQVSRAFEDRAESAGGRTVIRLGIASWQLGEFPWAETIRKYERANPDVDVRMSSLPEGSFNTMQAFWRYGHTPYDVVVAWADEEIHPFIHYHWSSPDPARRSLLVDVRDVLGPERFDTLMPGLCVGSSRVDPADPAGKRKLYYEIPWMGEVLALNYNKQYFAKAGIDRAPRTWAEVEEACGKLKGLKVDGKEIAPIAMNFSQSVFFAQNCYLPMLSAYRQGRGVADANGRLDVSSPEAVRVFETLKRWYDAGYISPNCMVNEAVEMDLKVRRAAMFPHWQSRGLEAMREMGGEVIDVKPTPGSAGTLVSTYGSIIPKCSPVVDRAATFAYEAFSTDEYGFQTAVAKAGKLPSMKELYAEKEQRPDLPRIVLDLETSLKGSYFFPDLANWSQCATILVVEFQRYLTGEHPTAEAALQAAQSRFAQEVYDEG